MNVEYNKLAEPFETVSVTSIPGGVAIHLFNGEAKMWQVVHILNDPDEYLQKMLLKTLFPEYSGDHGTASVVHSVGPTVNGKVTHNLWVDCDVDDTSHFMSEYGELITWQGIKDRYPNAVIIYEDNEDD